VMGTDAAWRMRAVQGYSPEVGMVSHWLGNPNEVLDATAGSLRLDVYRV
jgi:hypothetical protein